MNKRYKVHKDFRMANLVHAPTDPVGVNALNYLNHRAIERIDPGTEVSLEHISVSLGHETEVPLLLIRPRKCEGLQPCYIHFHGGGFMLKASPLLVRNMMDYARRVGCIVLLPDYRVLPDHPYPAAFEDACQVLEWVVQKGVLSGIDAARLAIGGDSAGGALAAGTVLWARDMAIRVLLQILIYPVTDHTQSSESLKLYWDAPVWNAEKNRRMWELYLPESELLDLGYASPLHFPNLTGLPLTYIEVAEYDCLRDEGRAYAEALRAAGNEVKYQQVDGGVHGYDNFLNSAYIDTYVNKRIRLLKKIFYKEGNTDAG